MLAKARTLLSASTITFAWLAASGSPTGYILQAGSSSGSSNVGLINMGNALSYTATGVPNGTYYVRTVATNACGNGPASNELVVSVPGAPTVSGLRFDSIRVTHQFAIGTPLVTNDEARTYSMWPPPLRNAGSNSFSLQNFPPNLLPSGGNSNVLAPSEMIMVGIRIENYVPTSGMIVLQWHKGSDDSVLGPYATVSLSIPSYGGSSYSSYALINTGHYSWEINEPGSYYVLINTTWGNARIDCEVTP